MTWSSERGGRSLAGDRGSAESRTSTVSVDDHGALGKQAALDEFFGALAIGLDQLYDAADALRHLGQSIAEGCSTPDDCIGDLNQIVSMLYSGAVSVLDAAALRITVHEVRR